MRRVWFRLFACFVLSVLITSCVRPSPNDPAHNDHDYEFDDYYWAELAQDYPPFELDTTTISVAAPQDRDELGQWGPVIDWPFVPVSAANLADGRILTWSSNRQDSFPPGTEYTYAATWDPASGTFEDIPLTSHDAFCAHTVILPDGRVLANGGTNHVPTTSLFDFKTNSWSQVEPMNRGRWYPTTVALPDGRVFTAIGSSGGQYPEVWTPDQGWDLLTGIDLTNPILSYDSHYERSWWPLLTVAPDGTIFHAGPTPVMHDIDPNGNGSIVPAGAVQNDWYPKHGTAVVYDEGMLLVAGGAVAGGNQVSSAMAMTIDINGTTPQVTYLAPMNHPRKFHNGVMLPDGEVLVVGGNTSGLKFNDSGSVLTAEIWNPDTRTWREVSDMSVPRNYHSIALLLPDGRVLSAGGGLCGCAADHWNAQVYTPPYLFAPDGSLAPRPVISQAPETVRTGQAFSVQASANIQSFSLIKMSATTHAVNTDLRYLPVNFSVQSPGNYRLDGHGNANVLTPGHYMLFALDAAGVPSVAKVVRVTDSGLPLVADPGDQTNVEGDNVSLDVEATDPDGDNLSYSATGLPPGLGINNSSGHISGTTNGSGSFEVTISVTDGNDGSSSIRFGWSIFDPDEQPGLVYRYYEGAWNSVPNFAVLTPVETGTVSHVNLSPQQRDDYYALQFEGRIRTPAGGSYTFYTKSDDGSRLWIDGQLVVDNDGLHGPTEQQGAIQLTGGDHEIVVEYLERTGGQVLTASYAGPGLAKREIPAEVLFLPGSLFVHQPGDQQGVEGETVSVQLGATSSGGSPTFSASGLPAGISLNPATGMITGTLAVGSSGSHAVTVTASDGNGGSDSDSVSFTWTVTPAPPLLLEPMVSPPRQVGLPIDFTATVAGGLNPRFRWLFGDGTPETPADLAPTASHTFTEPGRYVVTLTVTDDAGENASTQFVQAIHEPPTTRRPTLSMSLAYQQRNGNDRLWVANPDNDTVAVFDAISYAKLAEIPVGASPRAVAQAPDGTIWVTSKDAATISILDPNTLAVVQTVSLPTRSQPYGIAFDPSGTYGYVALEAVGWLLRLNPATGAQNGVVDVGPNPRHVAVSGDGSTVYVSRYITPPVPGEDGAAPQVWGGGGEIVVVTSGMTVSNTIVLGHSDRQDSEHSGRGLPNYLGPTVIAPDGLSAWVPSKQDNILRGSLRDGRNLTHDSTVRSISSRLDLVTDSEDSAARIDHDDGGIASSGLFGRYGSYLFVALEGSREVAVIDPYGYQEIARFEVGRAPQGLALSADGLTLYVHNFMDRTVSAHDISRIVNEGSGPIATLATMDAVASENLSSEVLAGKQLFYDARDPRLAFQNYLSCASCHNDGGHDGRVWDLSGFGEGVRNTIDLRGHAGSDHGPLHWSGNFDEVQDFEEQIRELAGGSGLMTNAGFHSGTRDQPLGDPKAGVSDDLDALAAYVTSLQSYPSSPHRRNNGTLTAAGQAGREVFGSLHCAQCHGGPAFSDSAASVLHDIGTLTPDSGGRLDRPLPGIDTPTLRGLWTTAPYLHDGSAATLVAAILAHDGVSASGSELDQLVAYLVQIDGNEPAPDPNAVPVPTVPANQRHAVGDSVSLTIAASDPDGDSLSFSASGLPPGLTIQRNSGRIVGVPEEAGSYAVAVTVADSFGSSASVGFDWEVLAAGRLEAVMVAGVSSSSWTPVTLNGNYPNMVAACSLTTANNTLPTVIRLRNTQGSGFQVRLQNPSGASLVEEDVACLISSEGAWTLPDGRSMEARRLRSTVTNYKGNDWGTSLDYLQGYANPVVFGQVMTYNDPDWSVFFSRGPGQSVIPSDGLLRVGKHVGEDPDTTRNTETLGVIVLEAGIGTLGTATYQVAVGPDTIKGIQRTHRYDLAGFDRAPEFALVTMTLVTMTAVDGGNGDWAAMTGPTPITSTGLTLVIDEDQLTDAERWHTTKQVNFLAIAEPIDVALEPADPAAAASLVAPAAAMALAPPAPDDPGDLEVFEDAGRPALTWTTIEGSSLEGFHV